MRSGGFPGQREALAARMEECRRESRRLATRRLFVGALVGGVAGLAGGAGAVYGLLARAAPPHRPAEPPRTSSSGAEEREARELATGALEVLVARRARFLMALRRVAAPDEVLWFGVERLANAALERSVPEHEKVRKALLAFSTVGPRAPGYVRAWYAALRGRRTAASGAAKGKK